MVTRFIFLQLNRVYHSRHPSPLIHSLPEETRDVQKKLAITGQPFKFSDLPQLVHDQLQSNLVNPEKFDDELRRCFDLAFTTELIRFTQNQNDAMKISLKVNEVDQTLWSFDIYEPGSGIAVDGFINEDTILRPDDRAALWEILDLRDLGEPVRVFSWNAPAKSYYLPAARSGIMQSHRVIASSLIDSVTRIGLERLPEVPTFSGMIADFLKHIINYKERDKSLNEIVDIANALENDVLCGKNRG